MPDTAALGDRIVAHGPALSWLHAHRWQSGVIGVVILALIGGAFTLGGSVANGRTKDLMAGVRAQIVTRTVTQLDQSPQMTTAIADFAIKLAQHAAAPGQNCLVSPLSAQLALALTANGAAGETQEQMLQVLAGGASMDDLNTFLSTYVANLPDTAAASFNSANSIWYNQDSRLTIEPTFLRANATYYDADAYSAPFDSGTLKTINNWVKNNTGGMIPRMLDDLDPSIVMLLLNALIFDAQWQDPYDASAVAPGVFNEAGGTQQDASFMTSQEATYLDDGQATGFVKPYAGGSYEFVALLPNQGVSVADYLGSLTGTKWLQLLATAKPEITQASLPSFSLSYDVALDHALIAMGLVDAFDPKAADFTNMATGAGLYIGKVLQKTRIDVTPDGTKAAAATEVEIRDAGFAPPQHEVKLDRPFIYAIVDPATNLPLFVGVAYHLDS